MITHTPATAKTRRPRSELCGDGIRREHRLGCDAPRCDCPYTFWKPRTATATRERARVYGSLADARRAKRQAEQAADKYRRTRANQLAGIVAMPTLDEWYATLLEREWSRVRVSTRERRALDYRRLQPTLGRRRLDQLTVPIIHAWLHDLIDRDGNRRCVQASHETLEAMLAVAVTHRLLPENTAKLVRYPVEQIQRREQHALTHDQYRALLDACRDVGERSMVRVLCEAGLRRSEIVALQIGDLDLDTGLIHVQRRHFRTRDGNLDVDTPKSHHARYAAINTSLADELRQHLAGRENRLDAPVWTRCNRYTAGEVVPLSGSAAYKILRRVSRKAGLHLPDDGKRVSPHVLRATGASLAVAAGVPEHIASRQLGHARIETTKRHYLRLPVIEPLRQIGAVFE